MKRLCSLLCLAVLASSAFGSITTNVNIVDFAFNPPSIRINVNDQVKWTWITSNHTTTANDGLWDSGPHSVNFTYIRAFTSAGGFPYHCSTHLFSGSILVTNPPPTVAITNPPNNAILAAPASLVLNAIASGSGDTVSNVQFLQGVTSLGNFPNPPYSRAVSGIGSGDYTFSAVATDSGGLNATNAITVHVVTPAPIVLTAPAQFSSAGFQFQYSTTPGLRYTAQRSEDLLSWTELSAILATSSLSTFVDNTASNKVGFYRVQLSPNP